VLRFDLSLAVSPLVVPAVLLVATCSMAIEYGIAYLATPELAGILSQIILFVALMFAPINYPADRLPAWLVTVREWMPFTYMAEAVRETVNVPPGGISPRPFVVLALWCAAGLAATYRVMTRRT
jgi:ABC-2 type transport system permease protein